MGKRAWISLPIIIILLAGIVGSFFLSNQKLDTSNVSPAQRIAAYTKPAVVQIIDAAVVQWDYSYVSNYYVYEFFKSLEGQTVLAAAGSGAIISSNGYIVTNAHVVELTRLSDEEIVEQAFANLAYQMASYFDISIEEALYYLYDYYAYGELGVQSVQKFQKVYLPNNEEPYDSDVKAYGAPVGEGKDVAVLKIDAKNLPTLQLGDSDTVQLQDDIWVIGYPYAADLNVLSWESSLVSTINEGKISATDKKSAQGSPVIQVSAATTHGNSGGPVVNSSGEIIGLLTFGNADEVQGFNFAVPSSTVLEYVAQSGAKPAADNIDKLYREGLNFYWAGYYEEALKRFQQVQILYDKHSEVKRLISDTQAKMSQSKTYWPKYTTYFYIYDAVSGLIIILLILFAFVLKPKKKLQAVATPPSPPEKEPE